MSVLWCAHCQVFGHNEWRWADFQAAFSDTAQHTWGVCTDIYGTALLGPSFQQSSPIHVSRGIGPSLSYRLPFAVPAWPKVSC